MSSADTIKMLTLDDKMLTSDLDRAGYRHMGIQVRHVASLTEANQVLNNEKIDVIVINLDFEKIDALGICKHFKAHNVVKEIPIVITSVQSSATARKSAVAVGADLFVEQPLPRQYFIEKIKKLLAKITRDQHRVSVEESVEVSHGSEVHVYKIADISASGLFAVEVESPIAEGEKVSLRFKLPGENTSIEASGTVVRHINDKKNKTINLGIRFDSFKKDAQRKLERYVAEKAQPEQQMRYYL